MYVYVFYCIYLYIYISCDYLIICLSLLSCHTTQDRPCSPKQILYLHPSYRRCLCHKPVYWCTWFFTSQTRVNCHDSRCDAIMAHEHSASVRLKERSPPLDIRWPALFKGPTFPSELKVSLAAEMAEVHKCHFCRVKWGTPDRACSCQRKGTICLY